MMPSEPVDLTISDDSSIFGLVDVARYKTFVDPDWSLDQLVKHFRSQARSLVVWYGGDSGLASVVVRVSHGITEEPGFREATTSISVSSGVLNLVSYNALTMAAQFDDESLPANNESGLTIEVPNGDYTVRLVQMYDPDEPEDFEDEPEGTPAFLIELDEGGFSPEDAIVWLPKD
jgi:hypothetical protein